MARPRVKKEKEQHELSDLALEYLETFGGGKASITPGFLRAYSHARNHGNDEKPSVLFAMNHGMDEEFDTEDA